MKNIILIICCLFGLINLILANTNTKFGNPTESKSITFILGEDEDHKDQYYDLAKQYYLLNPDAKTDFFIDDCRSLIGVRNQLEKIASEHQIHWSNVNLIVHSNQWTGMSVAINESESRTNVDALIEVILDGSFQPVSDHYVNTDTKIHIKACGLGKNDDLIEALQMAFGGMDEQQPEMYASPFFIQYFENEFGVIESTTLKPFYAFYKTAYKPADLHIQKQFQQRYPNELIDWLAVLTHKQGEKSGLFSKKFNVPVEWEIILPKEEKVKHFKSEKDKLALVNQQEELIELLDKFNIPIEKFRWNVTTELQGTMMTVKIKGKATVVCVLREV